MPPPFPPPGQDTAAISHALASRAFQRGGWMASGLCAALGLLLAVSADGGLASLGWLLLALGLFSGIIAVAVAIIEQFAGRAKRKSKHA